MKEKVIKATFGNEACLEDAIRRLKSMGIEEVSFPNRWTLLVKATDEQREAVEEEIRKAKGYVDFRKV